MGSATPAAPWPWPQPWPGGDSADLQVSIWVHNLGGERARSDEEYSREQKNNPNSPPPPFLGPKRKLPPSPIQFVGLWQPKRG